MQAEVLAGRTRAADVTMDDLEKHTELRNYEFKDVAGFDSVLEWALGGSHKLTVQHFVSASWHPNPTGDGTCCNYTWKSIYRWYDLFDWRGWGEWKPLPWYNVGTWPERCLDANLDGLLDLDYYFVIKYPTVLTGDGMIISSSTE